MTDQYRSYKLTLEEVELLDAIMIATDRVTWIWPREITARAALSGQSDIRDQWNLWAKAWVVIAQHHHFQVTTMGTHPDGKPYVMAKPATVMRGRSVRDDEDPGPNGFG